METAGILGISSASDFEGESSAWREIVRASPRANSDEEKATSESRRMKQNPGD